MHERPTKDPKAALLDALDGAWDQLRARLDGIDDAEFLWEPAPEMWTVRAVDGAGALVDGIDRRDADPAPVTTIAWRLWHIAVDCNDGYSERLFGRTGSAATGASWYLHVEPALADLDQSWNCFRGGVGELSDEAIWDELGDQWGPFSRHSNYDLALHALHEITHHGAEVAVLRDLYRAQRTRSTE